MIRRRAQLPPSVNRTMLPAIGSTIYYAACGKVVAGVVADHRTHVGFKTPYVTLEGKGTCLHPDYAHAVQAHAEAEAEAFRQRLARGGALNRYVLQEVEQAKLDALPPDKRAAHESGARERYEIFKQNEAGRAIQAVVPGLSLKEANRRFVEAMEVFQVVHDAFGFPNYDIFTRAISEELAQIGQGPVIEEDEERASESQRP